MELVRNAFPAVSEPLPAPRTADSSSPDAGAAPDSSSPDSAAELETVGVPETGCAAILAVTNSWDSGFQADVSVVAGEQLTGWNVPLVLPAGTWLHAAGIHPVRYPPRLTPDQFGGEQLEAGVAQIAEQNRCRCQANGILQHCGHVPHSGLFVGFE